MIKPVCVIAARKGSKRIKNKNIKLLYGKPLISYSIKTAIDTKIFSNVFVTTDCKQISTIAKKYGAKVPFIRSKKLSNDKVGLRPVVFDCIKKTKSYDADYVCYIYATAANIDKKTIISAYKKIKKINYHLIVGVKEAETNPLRFFVKKGQQIKYYNNKYSSSNSNNLKKFYSDAGTFFIYKNSQLKKKGLPKKTTYYLHKKYETVDVDTIDDFNHLKKIFKKKGGNYVHNKK